MRIQYRYRQLTTEYRVGYDAYSGISMTDWMDSDADGMLGPVASNSLLIGELQVRLVDENGNAVAQTPAFKPAYYQRKSGSQPGGITWCTTEPDRVHWKRRDDIKP